MVNPDTDFLFPSRAISPLQSLRGPDWDALVARASAAAETDPDHLAFILMIATLNKCDECNADSFKAMRGCTACAVQLIERFNGTDSDLLAHFQDALEQVSAYLQSVQKLG